MCGPETRKRSAAQYHQHCIFLRGMDQHRLNVAEMPLQPQIGTKTGQALVRGVLGSLFRGK